MSGLAQPSSPARPAAGVDPLATPRGLHPELAIAQAQARRTLRLTPRWTPMKPHPGQSLFCWHPAPIKICTSGRRSGKTECGKRKAVMELIRRRPWPANVLIGAPTHEQVRKIYWEDMKALVPAPWVAKINETRLEIRTKWGALLQLKSLDRPQRIEGVPWDWMLLDEMADCPARLWGRNIVPALSTLGRTISADLIGVPDEVGKNQAEFEQLWERGLQWPRHPEICSFHWRSEDILEKEKIETLRSIMDALEFEQEVGGRFVTSGGKALPDFDTSFHVQRKYAAYDPRLPLDWTLDFGVTPACSLVCQTWGGSAWVIAEIWVDNGSTDAQLEAFRGLLGDNGWRPRSIRVFGDAAGHGRHSPLGETDYKVLEERTRDLPIQWRQLRAAPPIKDTLNAVRGRVKAANGLVRLHISPDCPHLIDNCKTAPWPDKLEKFHAMAGLRYYCYELFGEEPAFVGTSPLGLPSLGTSGS